MVWTNKREINGKRPSCEESQTHSWVLLCAKGLLSPVAVFILPLSSWLSFNLKGYWTVRTHLAGNITFAITQVHSYRQRTHLSRWRDWQKTPSPSGVWASCLSVTEQARDQKHICDVSEIIGNPVLHKMIIINFFFFFFFPQQLSKLELQGAPYNIIQWIQQIMMKNKTKSTSKHHSQMQ